VRTWLFQDPKQVAKHGTDKAPWCVGWRDPAGKRRSETCGPGKAGRLLAAKRAEKIHAELITGAYDHPGKKTWKQFREEFEAKVLAVKGVRHREETKHAMDQFERVVNPGLMKAITSRTLADFTAKRSKERGLKKGSIVSVATINKELRHLRVAIRRAHKWGYLTKLPDFEFIREPKKLATYVTPDHFAAIYAACDAAKFPTAQPYNAGDWWRGLLVTAYMTGWRISALLAIRREDVDFEAGTVLTRAEDNKGKRDQRIPLHPLAIEHLRQVPGFSPVLFPWNHARRILFKQFIDIHRTAKLKFTGPRKHYGFHDLRRAFATMNADRLTPDALQHLMQHKDYKTTQRYINMARQMNTAVAGLYVPDLSAAKKAIGGL
jgi:integrase